jgi:hypothetical protein
MPVSYPSRGTKGSRYKTSVIIEALRQSGGLVFLAAKSLGCSASSIYVRAKKSRVVKAAIQGPRGELVDVAESKLKSAVFAGDPRARNFVLSTLGKKRGYVRAKEVRHVGVPSRKDAPPGAEDISRITVIIAALASVAEGGKVVTGSIGLGVDGEAVALPGASGGD